MVGYKISIPKSVAFLLARQNNQLENTFKKMIALITKMAKYMGINLPRALQDLYEGIFKSQQGVY